MAVSRESARQAAFRAQVVAVVLVVAAGGVAASSAFLKEDPLARVGAPAASGPVTPVVTEGPSGPPRSGDIDTLGITSTLWQLGNPPVDEPIAEASDPAKPPIELQPPPRAGNDPNGQPGWRYIGQIVGPRSTHALLERSGLQRLVSAGGEAEGTRVLEIHKDYVMLDDGSGPRRVTIAEAANAWEMIGSRPPANPAAANITRPPGYDKNGRPGVQPVRPPPIPQGPRPGQTQEEADEMRLKMEELKRQREESGEMGANDPEGAGGRLARAGAGLVRNVG